ncbi:MAG: hypothetical protein ACR2P8_03530 [Myxococcota bacterium]
MNLIRPLLALALLASGCVAAAPVGKNWEWVGSGPDPGEAKLLEQYSVCSGFEPCNENTSNPCMGDAGWVRRRPADDEG